MCPLLDVWFTKSCGGLKFRVCLPRVLIFRWSSPCKYSMSEGPWEEGLHCGILFPVLLQTHKIKCDKSTGIIEMVMDQFTIENEGTYTVQIHDGKAKNQSSLVLIGDGKRY